MFLEVFSQKITKSGAISHLLLLGLGDLRCHDRVNQEVTRMGEYDQFDPSKFQCNLTSPPFLMIISC